MKLYGFLVLGAFGAVSSTVLGVGNQDQPKTHEYILKVEANGMTKLDMLLVFKSDPKSGPDREQATITTPYTKKFRAAKCYAWFDTLPDGKSGADGTKYSIKLFVDGKPSSEVSEVLKKTNKSTGGLGDL